MRTVNVLRAALTAGMFMKPCDLLGIGERQWGPASEQSDASFMKRPHRVVHSALGDHERSRMVHDRHTNAERRRLDVTDIR